MNKPKQRSAWRARLGGFYFTQKRYLQWIRNWSKFAKTKTQASLPYLVFSHHTPLYRQLRNVDQWLQDNKVINLKIALKKINDLIVKPGETFSYWHTIGKPTKRKGYVPGMILRNGGFTSAIGGGLCQLSNLLFWITAHSPLMATERWRHGYDVFPDSNRTQPFGSGATCSYNYIDLQIKNPTHAQFQLKIHMTNTDLIGELYSDIEPTNIYEVYEKKHRIIHEPWGGYSRHNELWKKTIDRSTQRIIHDEYLIENHAIMMYTPFLTTKNTP